MDIRRHFLLKVNGPIRIRFYFQPINSWSADGGVGPNAGEHSFTGVFLDQVRSRGLRVYQAPDLKEHVLNAVLVETARGIRLAKEKSSKKIDGAVALAMALWSAQQHGYGDGIGIWF